MKKALIAIVVVILILLVGGAVFLPSIAKPAVEKAAESRGIDMEVGGISVGVMSGSVGLSKFGLANEQGYQDAKLATVDEVEVNAKLMPLIRGDLAVDSIRVDEPVLNLERLVSGNINLADFISRISGGSTSSTSGEATPFRVDRITIDGGTVQWTDRNVPSGVASIKVQDLDVNVQDVYTPMPAGTQDTKVHVTGAFSPPAGGTFELNGKGNFLEDALDFTMDLSFSGIGLTGFREYYSTAPIVPQGGKASGTITATCTQNKIKGVAKISFSELSLAANESGAAAMKLPSQAVGKLAQLQPVRDFEVPFEGDITDPTFHLFQGVMLSGMAYAGNLGPELASFVGKTGVDLTETAAGIAGEAATVATEQVGKALEGVTGKGGEAAGQLDEAVGGAADKANEAIGGLLGGFGKKKAAEEQ